MKNTILIVILLINNICLAQNVINVTKDDILVKEYRDSTLVILKKDSSLLKQGNYQLTIGGQLALDFQINSSGHTEGNVLAYRDNGFLGRKTTIKDGRTTMKTDYSENGILSDSTIYGMQNIELYDSVSKKLLTKKCWVKHEFELQRDSKNLQFETKYCGKQKIMSKTFYNDNKVKSIEFEGNYENLYDENGIVTSRTTYNWKTNEITKLHYEKGKLHWSEIEFNEKFLWKNRQVNSYATAETIEIVDGKVVQKANKNYTITTIYYPNGKIKSTETKKNGEILSKEFSPDGKLLKKESKKIEYAPPVMMGN